MNYNFVKIIAFILVIIFLFCGCKHSTTSVQETSNKFIEETTLPTTTYTPESTTPPTTDPPIIAKEVQGSLIAGYLSFDGATTYYSYKAPVTGIYRFDFDINNVNYNYSFKLLSSKEEVLCSERYDDNGVSCCLEKDEIYNIIIEQVSGDPEYNIKIGIPKEPSNINGNEFSSTIKYKDQEDIYYYSPSISGNYRFDFDTDNVNYNYKFKLYGEKFEEIAYSSYDNLGVNCDLEAGMEYKIIITQSDGLPTYTIKIGIPKQIKQIDNGIYNGKIKYIGQTDRFTSQFEEGDYHLIFSNINSNSEIKVQITSSNYTEILRATPTEDVLDFTINKKGMYNIYIYQCEGFTDYKISIYE